MTEVLDETVDLNYSDLPKRIRELYRHPRQPLEAIGPILIAREIEATGNEIYVRIGPGDWHTWELVDNPIKDLQVASEPKIWMMTGKRYSSAE